MNGFAGDEDPEFAGDEDRGFVDSALRTVPLSADPVLASGVEELGPAAPDCSG